MKSEVKKSSRRRFLAVGSGAVGGLLVATNFDIQPVHAQEKPYVIALHGYNGTTESGFIGSLSNFLTEQSIPYETPLLPGGLQPNRDEWESIIRDRISNAPRKPILVAYSLSVIAALGALSQKNVEVAKLSTVSGRKIRPSLPVEFPDTLTDFYGGGVNVDQIRRNAVDRLVVHSRDDTVVRFEGNAQQLAEQLDARTYFVDGMGHFDQSVPNWLVDQYSRRIALI